MSTRRNVKTAESDITKGNANITPSPARKAPQGSGPVVPGAVLAKLLLFTLAMIAGPLGTYYISVTLLFKDQSVVAGALAAVAANAVLIAYIVAAMREDDPEAEAKKGQ